MMVVDASVFNKLFLIEAGSDEANLLFREAISNSVTLMAPSIILYEALSAALRFEIPFAVVVNCFDVLRNAGLSLVEPDLVVLTTAEQMSRTGSFNAGYPGLNDCIYHALAIESDGTFVTADHRHYAKTKKFGHVMMLAEAVAAR